MSDTRNAVGEDGKYPIPAGGADPAVPAAEIPAGGADPAVPAGEVIGSPAYYEAIARKKGWRPKEEHDPNTEEVWVDATEFVTRTPLFEKNSKLNKQVKELQRTVEALSKHYNLTIEQAKTRAVDELKLQRKEAIEIGDAVQVDAIDQQIQQVGELPPPVVERPVLASEIEDFVEEQKEWFNKDKEMTSFAVAYNEAYLKEHPGDLEKSLAETLKKVKLAFPDKFTNTRRSDPPPVDTGSSTPGGGTGSKYTMNRLNHEQKLVYEQLVVRHKQITHEQYFKDLDEAGFLEK